MKDNRSPFQYLENAQGLSLRYGHWPCPDGEPRATVLLLQGRSEYMEKYAETISELHSRRLDVFSFDWQGQGLSDRLLPEREKGFVRHYDDYLADLDLIVDTVVRPRLRGPLYLLCHSMGGHLGLRYLGRNAHIVEKAVVCAPMIGIDTHPLPPFIVRWMCRWQVAVGNGHKVVVGSVRRTPFPDRFEGNFLTSDRHRFFRNRKLVTERPEFSAALITYGWLAASFDSGDILTHNGFADALKTPLLFASATDDRIVSNRALHAFAAATPNSRMVRVEGARHEILQEADPLRDRFWRAFDGFIGEG